MRADAPPFGLIGAPVRVLVARPWDFASQDGRGRLVGRVVAVAPDGAEVILDFPALTEISPGDVRLRALPLHRVSESVAVRIAGGQSVAVRLYGVGEGPPRFLGAAQRMA